MSFSMEEEQEIAQFVKKLTEEIHTKFGGMLDNALTKIDSMTQRIEDLEKKIGDLSDR